MPPTDEELPFAIELWNPARTGLEKVLARAVNLTLARAIFQAALEENPGRRVVLRHRTEIVDQSPNQG